MARPGLAWVFSCYFGMKHPLREFFTSSGELRHFESTISSFRLLSAAPLRSAFLGVPPIWTRSNHLSFVESNRGLDYCSPTTTCLPRSSQPCTMGRCPNQRYHTAFDVGRLNVTEMSCVPVLLTFCHPVFRSTFKAANCGARHFVQYLNFPTEVFSSIHVRERSEDVWE